MAIVIAIVTIAIPTANASSDGGREGKAQGHSDAINGRSSDASCGSGHSNSYCAAYKIAYLAEFHWTNIVQD